MFRSGCPLASALDLIGDKWSLVIIRDLFIERSTFKEFLNSPEGIASNILAQRLKWLREKGIIDFAFKLVASALFLLFKPLHFVGVVVKLFAQH